jgi:glyoxylase-like metal-dependent hydrolase (beta-lactamase superfamily II)
MIDPQQGEGPDMSIRQRLCFTLLALLAVPAMAQNARTVLADASKAMGLDGVTSLYFYGSGATYSIGQNNNPNGPWPKTPLNEYTRAINFGTGATRATWTTFATPVTGGAPTLNSNGLQNVTSTSPWAQQVELWITPWGFLKGAEANNATAQRRTVGGKRYQVISWDTPTKSPGGKSYRMVGYLNADNLVEKVETWLDHPVFGDMHVEAEYSFYRDNNGLKYPSEIVQKRAGWPAFDLQVLGAFANPAKLAQLMPAPAAAAPRAGGPPGGAPAGGPPAGGGGPPAAAAITSAQLAPGVFHIKSAYNSLAVEFADHVVLFEPGPQNEARAVAGIAEVKRLFPNKPIRYGVPTHHHIDHTGGIAAVAAEGITLVTPEVSKAFYEKALGTPRTLAPDLLAKSGKKVKVESFKGDKHVFQDATRTLEIHVVKGLPHADGMVIAWLPREKIMVYADMFNWPPAATPVADPPVIGSMVFMANIERLGLDPVGILSIHTMNPDRLVTLPELRSSLGTNRL